MGGAVLLAIALGLCMWKLRSRRTSKQKDQGLLDAGTFADVNEGAHMPDIYFQSPRNTERRDTCATHGGGSRDSAMGTLHSFPGIQDDGSSTARSAQSAWPEVVDGHDDTGLFMQHSVESDRGRSVRRTSPFRESRKSRRASRSSEPAVSYREGSTLPTSARLPPPSFRSCTQDVVDSPEVIASMLASTVGSVSQTCPPVEEEGTEEEGHSSDELGGEMRVSRKGTTVSRDQARRSKPPRSARTRPPRLPLTSSSLERTVSQV